MSVALPWRRLCTLCRSVRAPSTAIWLQASKRELFTDKARRASLRLVTRVLGLGQDRADTPGVPQLAVCVREAAGRGGIFSPRKGRDSRGKKLRAAQAASAGVIAF